MTVVETIKNYSIETIKAGQLDGSQFDFFRFEYFAQDIEHLSKNHRHEFHAIIFITSGGGSHIIDFVEYPLQADRCFYIGYGQIHAWKALENVKGFILLFTDDFYNIVYTGHEVLKSDRLLLELNTYSDLNSVEKNELLLSLQQIESEFEHTKNDWKLIVCLLLKTLIIRLRRSDKQQAETEEGYKRRLVMISEYRELINKHFTALKSPMEYAAKLNITPNYLNTLCKEATGKSAGQLIKERIILEAKRLIIHTQLTISEVSHQIGFDDKSHFGKYFKNAVGQSPDQFRKEYKAKSKI
jgi:AraC-like DNA-binding protein